MATAELLRTANASRSAPGWLDDDEVDPWGLDGPSEPASTSIVEFSPVVASSPLKSAFLEAPTETAAFSLAAEGDFERLRVVLRGHGSAFSYVDRLDIIGCIPIHTSPLDYLDLLPSAEASNDNRTTAAEPWLKDADGSESADSVHAKTPVTVTDAAISAWYHHRIERIDRELGLVDIALNLVQLGASKGVANLEEAGEELSLLTKLIYDRSPAQTADLDDVTTWTLTRWRSAQPNEIVRAYLAYSTPATVANDIRRLVLPYLYVLESRRERQGAPDTELHVQLLHDYILDISQSRLDIVASICDSSKPTLPTSKRLIKTDEELARLALSCLYGNTSVDEWPSMSAIFECMPAFDESITDEEKSASDSPFSKLFVPSTSLSHSLPSAADIYQTLSTMTLPALSRALDALDVHLESAEILARWNAPQPLAWFIRSAKDASAQRAWCTRLARRAGGGVERGGEDFESEDEWSALMDDMCRLAGNREVGSDLRGAFGMLRRDEVLSIFFGGLLSSGKFDLARSLFNPSGGSRPLEPAAEEELVIAASREFYDNAETGNMYKGVMKLAYDVLAVAPPTTAIRRERDFIEATSRLASFNIISQPGVPLSPIEVRLAKDKLDLVRRLLASNDDAHRHPDVILELVSKLGYHGDRLAEVRALGMIVDAAVRAHDLLHAADVCDRIVAVINASRRSDSDYALAVDVAWRSCVQVGQQPDFDDMARRMRLLGHALLLCPDNHVADLLKIWRGVENQTGVRGEPAIGMGHSSAQAVFATTLSGESAARAARSFGRAATAYFRPLTPSPGRSTLPTIEQRLHDVGQYQPGASGPRSTLSDRLTASVGWLIGADDEVG